MPTNSLGTITVALTYGSSTSVMPFASGIWAGLWTSISSPLTVCTS